MATVNHEGTKNTKIILYKVFFVSFVSSWFAGVRVTPDVHESGRYRLSLQKVLDRRRDDERQDHRDQNPADDRNGERLQHL